MITVTGATGQFGGGVIENLLQKGLTPSQITVMVRNEEKAQSLKAKGVNVKIGNYNDHSSMVEAFKGTDKLLFVSSSEMQNRSQQQVGVVKAAQEAGVKHILYTSIQRQSDSADSPIAFVANDHIATENAIKESGMQYTMLRNNLYFDILPWILGEKVFETGVFYPSQDGKVGFALRSDMAEAAANVLLADQEGNNEFNISSPSSFTFADVAQHLSTIAGKPVSYYSPSVEEYIQALTAGGAPQEVSGFLAGFAAGAASGEFVPGDSDLPQLLGREPISYKAFLDGVYGQK
jgi:NAD(P)H dehydrogenase (quinone)